MKKKKKWSLPEVFGKKESPPVLHRGFYTQQIWGYEKVRGGCFPHTGGLLFMETTPNHPGGLLKTPGGERMPPPEKKKRTPLLPEPRVWAV